MYMYTLHKSIRDRRRYREKSAGKAKRIQCEKLPQGTRTWLYPYLSLCNITKKRYNYGSTIIPLLGFGVFSVQKLRLGEFVSLYITTTGAAAAAAAATFNYEDKVLRCFAHGLLLFLLFLRIMPAKLMRPNVNISLLLYIQTQTCQRGRDFPSFNTELLRKFSNTHQVSRFGINRHLEGRKITLNQQFSYISTLFIKSHLYNNILLRIQ